MRRHLVIPFCLLLLAGAACSGDDTLSEEEFLKQANAICAEGNSELEAAADEVIEGGDPSQEELEGLIDTAVDNVGAQLDEIEDLAAPEDLQGDVDDLIETARGELEKLEETGAEAFTSGEAPFAESNAKAEEIGLDDCADDDS